MQLGSIHTRKPAGDSTSNEIINAHFTQPSEAKTKTDPGAVSKEDSCHQIQPEVSTILNVADQTPSDSQPPLIEEVHSSIEQTQQVNALPTGNVVDSYEQQTGEDLVTSSKESYDWKCKRGKYVKKGAPKKANVKEGTPGKHNPPVRDTCTSTSALPQVILQQEVLIGDQNETIPAPPTEATSTSTTIPFSSPYRLSQLKQVEGTPAWDGLECVDTQHPLIETVPPHRTLPEVPEVEKAGVEVKNKGTNVEAKIAENEAQLSQYDQGMMIGHGQSALSTTSTITDEIPLCVQPLKPDETGASYFESVQQHTTCSEGIVDPHGYRNGEDQDMISKEPYDWKRKRGRYVKRDQRKKTNTGEEALGKPSPPQDANTPQSLPQTPSQQGLIEGQSEIKSVLITELPSMDVASMASREALLIAATTNVSLQISADSIPTSDMSVDEASKRNGIRYGDTWPSYQQPIFVHSEAVCDTLPSELSNGEYSVEGQPLASKAGDKDGTVVGLGKAENDRPAIREEVYPHDRIILHPVAVHLPGAKISTNEQGQAEVSITSSITGATPLSTQQCATPPVDATDISKHQTGDLDTTREESFDWRHKRGTHVKKKSQRKKTNDGEEAQEKYHPPPPDTSTTSLPQVSSHQDALISVGSIFQHFVEPTPTAPNETLAKLVCVGLENVETQPPYQQPTSGLSGDVLDRMLSELPSVEKGNTEGKLDVKLSTSENQEVIVVVLGKAECDIPAETVEAHFKQEDILQPVVIHTPDTKTRPHTKDLDVSSEGLKSDKGQTAASISSIVSGLDIQLSKLDGKVVSAIEKTQQLITPPEDTVDPHEHQTDTTSKEYFDWKSKRGKYVKKKKTNTGEVVLEKHYKPLQDASTASSQQVPSQQDRTETETIEPTSTNPIETIAELSHPTLVQDTAFSISTEPDEEATKHSSIGGGLKCVDTPPPCQQQTSEPNGTIVDGSIIDDRIEAKLEVMSLRDGGGESVAVSLCEPAEAIINAAINGLNVSSLETAFDKKEHPELSINATLPPDIQPSKVEEVFSTIETTQQLIILPEDTVHSQKTGDLDTTREESFDWRRKRGTHVKKKSQRKKTNDGEEVQHHPPPQETNAASLPQVPSHQDALIRVETEILSVEPTHTVPTVIMAELSHATLVQDTALSIQTEPDEETSKHSSIGGGLESVDTPPSCQQPTSDPNGTILDGTQSEVSIIEDRIEAKLDNVSLRDVGGESVAISLLSPAEAIISAAMKDLKVSSLETAFDNKEHPELSINAILPPDIQPSKVEEVLSTIETTQHLITLPEDTVHSQTGDLDTTREESFDWRRKRGTQVKKKSQRKKTNNGEEAQHHPPPQETNAASLPQVPSHQDTLIRVETGILSVEAPHTVPSEIMAELSHPTLELDTALPTAPDEEASKHSSIGGGLESVDTPPPCQLQTSEPSGTIPERALLEVSSKIEAKLDVMTLRDGEGECVAVSLCEPAVKEMPHLLEEKIPQHMTVLHPAEVTISAAIKDLNVSSLETVFDKKEQPELPTTTTNSADIQPSKPEWNVVSTIETITPPEDTADQHEHQIGDLDTTREESFDWRRKRGTQVKKKSQRKKTNDGEEAQHHPPPQETNAASLPQVSSHQDTLIRVETKILYVEPPHTVPTETIAELSHPTLELDTALPTEPDEEASKHSSIGGGLESVDTPPPCQLQISEPSGTIPERALLEVSSKIEAKLDIMTLRDGEGESVAVSLCEPAVKEMPHLQEEKILQHMTVLHPAEVTISAAIKDLNVSFLETVFDKKEQPELPTTTTNSAAIQPSKPEWNVVSTIETITPPEDNAYPHEHQTGDLDTTREESFDWRRKRGTQVKKKSQRKKTNDGEEVQHHPSPQETNAASLPHVPSYQDALIRVEIEILSVEPTHTVPTVIMAELSHVTLVRDTALSIQTEPDEEASKHSSIGGGLESVDTPPSCQQPTSDPNGTFRDGTQSEVSIIEDRIEAKLDVMSLRDGWGESVAISLLSPAEAIISAAMKDLKVSSLETAFDNKEHPELSINAILPPDIQPSKVEEVLSTTETTQHLITLPEDTVHSQTGDLDTTMKESFDWRRKRGTQVKKKSQRKKTNDGEEAQHHPPPQETNAASLPQVPSHQDTLIRVETGILSVEAPHTVPSEIMAELSHPTLELDTALPTAPDDKASKHSPIGGGLESVDTPPSCQLQISEPSGTIPERALLEVSSKIEAKLDVMTLRDGEGESVAVSLCEPAVKEMPHLLEEKILQHMTVLHPAEVTTSAAIKDLNVSSLETVFDKKEQPELPTTATNSADIQPSKPEWNVVSTIETITPPEDNAYPHEHQTGDLDTTMEESFDWSRKRGTQVKKKSQRKKTNDGEEAQHHPPPQETNAASLPHVPSHQNALIRVETEILSVEPTHIVPTVIMAELSHVTLVQDTALSIQTEPDEETSKHSSIGGGLESVDTPPSCQQPTSDPNGTILDGTQSEVSIIEDRIEAKLDVMSLRDGWGESVAISLLSPAEAIISAAIKDQNVSSLETAFDKKEHPELSINAILSPDIQPSKVEEVLSTIETTQHLITLPEDTVHSQTGHLDTTREESFDWSRKRGTQVKKKSQRKKTNDGEEAQHHPPPQETNAASLPHVPSHQDALIRVETGILSVEVPHTVPTETIAELSHPTLELDTALPTEPDEEASKHSSIGGGLESVDTPPSCQLQTSEPSGTIPDRALLEVSSKIEAKLDVMTLRDGKGESVAVSLCEPAVKEMPHLQEEKILQHMTVLHPAEVTISAAIKDLNVSFLETVFDKKEQPELPTTTTNSADIQPSKPEWNVVSTIETITPPEDTADQHEHQIGDLDTTREESFDWRRKRGTQVKKKSQKKTNYGEEAQHHPPPQETNAASLPQVPSHQDALIRVETEILSVEAPHTVPTEIIAELSHPTLVLDTALPIPTEPDEEANKRSSIGGGLECVDIPPCQQPTSDPNGTIPVRAYPEAYPEVSSVEQNKLEGESDVMLSTQENEESTVLCGAKDETTAMKEMSCVHLEQGKTLQLERCVHPAEANISADIKDLHISLERVIDKKEVSEVSVTATIPLDIQPSKLEALSTIGTTQPLIPLPEATVDSHEHQTRDLDANNEESIGWRHNRGTHVKKGHRRKTNTGKEALVKHHSPLQVVSTSVSLQFISQQTLPLSEAMVDTVDEISVADCVHKHMVYNNSDKHALVNSCGFLVQETDVVKLPAEMTNLEQPNTEDTTFVIPEGEKTINLVKENLPITDTVCSVNLKGFNDYVIGDEQQQHTAESNELLPQAGSTPYIQRGTTTSHLTEAIPPEVINTTAGKRHIHGSLEGAKCEQGQQEESIVESPSDVVTPKIVGDLISIIEPAKQLNAQQADTVSDGTTEADVVIPSMPQGHKLVHLTYARPKRSARAPSKGLRMSFGEHSNFPSTSTGAQQAADEGGLKGPHFLEPAQEVSPSRCIESSDPDHMVATPTTTTSLASELHRAFRHPKWSTLVCPIDKYEEQTPVTSRADTDAAGTGSNYPYITLKTDGAVKPITESSITTSTHPTLMPNVLQTSTTPKSTITASGISLTTELHNVFTLPKWRKITGVCAVEPVEHHDSNSHTWPRCRLAANVLSDEIIDRTPSEVPGMEVSIEGNLDIIMAPTDGHKLVHLTHSRPKRSARAPSKGITRLAGVHSKVSTTEERLTSHLVADGNRLTEPHHLELSQDLHKTDAIPVAPIIALHTLPTSLSSELHHMFTLPKWRKLMCPIDVYDEQIPVTSCENATTVEESNIARTTGQVDSNLIPTPTTLVASSETSVAIVTTSSPYSTPVLDAIQTVTSLRTLTNDVHRTLPVPLTTDVVGTSVPPEAHLEVMYDNHTAVCCELEKESLHQQPTSVHSEDSFGRTPSKVPSVEDCVEGKRSNIVPTEGQNEGVVSDEAMIKSACDVADTANDSNKDKSPISLANVSLVQSNIGAHVTSLDGSTEVLMCDEGQPEVPIILSVDCESPLDIGAPIHEGVLQIAITSPPNTTEQPLQQTQEEDVDGAGTDPFQWKRKKRIKIGLSMPTNAKDAVFHQHLGQHSSTPLEIAQPDPLVLSAPNNETREPSLQAERTPEMPTAHTEQVERNAISLGYVTPSDMLHRPHASVDEDAGTTDKSVTATYEDKPRDDRGLLSLTVTSEENIKTAAFSGPQIEIPLPLNELKIMLPSEAMSIALPETMSLGIAEVVPTALIGVSPTDQATSPSTVFSELRMVEPTENLDQNNTMKDMAANDTLEALHERNGKQNTNLDTHPATFETSVHVPHLKYTAEEVRHDQSQLKVSPTSSASSAEVMPFPTGPIEETNKPPCQHPASVLNDSEVPSVIDKTEAVVGTCGAESQKLAKAENLHLEEEDFIHAPEAKDSSANIQDWFVVLEGVGLDQGQPEVSNIFNISFSQCAEQQTAVEEHSQKNTHQSDMTSAQHAEAAHCSRDKGEFITHGVDDVRPLTMEMVGNLPSIEGIHQPEVTTGTDITAGDVATEQMKSSVGQQNTAYDVQIHVSVQGDIITPRVVDELSEGNSKAILSLQHQDQGADMRTNEAQKMPNTAEMNVNNVPVIEDAICNPVERDTICSPARDVPSTGDVPPTSSANAQGDTSGDRMLPYPVEDTKQSAEHEGVDAEEVSGSQHSDEFKWRRGRVVRRKKTVPKEMGDEENELLPQPRPRSAAIERSISPMSELIPRPHSEAFEKNASVQSQPHSATVGSPNISPCHDPTPQQRPRSGAIEKGGSPCHDPTPQQRPRSGAVEKGGSPCHDPTPQQRPRSGAVEKGGSPCHDPTPQQRPRSGAIEKGGSLCHDPTPQQRPRSGAVEKGGSPCHDPTPQQRPGSGAIEKGGSPCHDPTPQQRPRSGAVEKGGSPCHDPTPQQRPHSGAVEKGGSPHHNPILELGPDQTPPPNGDTPVLSGHKTSGTAIAAQIPPGKATEEKTSFLRRKGARRDASEHHK